MRLLLDTNIYVFMVNDRQSLTKDVSELIEDPENLKYMKGITFQYYFGTERAIAKLTKL